MKEKEAIILGAGITGLTTAWKLAKIGVKVTLIEKENSTGGLAGTIDWDGWKFDFGAHGFFSKHQEIIDFYSDNLKEKFLPRKVKTEIFIFDKLIKYPLVGAQVFTALSTKHMFISGVDFFLTRLKALLFGIKETEYLDEWIISRFGNYLYNIYFGPYISRIQKKDPHLLSKDIGLKKIPVFSIRQYFIREFIKSKKIHPNELMLQNTFYVKGGYGEIPNFFINELKKMDNVTISMNEEVKSIELNNNRITKIETDKNLYKTIDGYVVSTIPIEYLFNAMNCGQELKNISNKLEYSRMRLLLLKTKRKLITGNDWTMFNGEEIQFNRVSESWHDEFEIVPEGCTSLTFEFPLNKEERLWSISDKELLDETLPVFNKVFPLKRDEIVDFKSIRVDHSNPRMVLGYHKVLEDLFAFIMKVENLSSFGRQGLFTYINLDGCTKTAFDFCDVLINGTEKEYMARLLSEYHDITII